MIPRRANVCAVIVTHHPSSDLTERLTQIRSFANETVIVDNGSFSLEVACLRELANQHHVELILNDMNLGIATAMNQGVRYAIRREYAWVLLLDQDTIPLINMLEVMSQVYEHYPRRNKLAILGANYRDGVSGKTASGLSRPSKNRWVEKKTVISSGSLISLPVFSAVGPFRDEFFIDGVDLEYCLRVRDRGFKVLMTRDVLMKHHLGSTTLHRFAGIRRGTSNHSPVRRYYMARNEAILARQYLFKDPIWVGGKIYSRLRSTILFCLFEQDRYSKLKHTALGLVDGVLGHFGRDFHRQETT